MPNVAEKGTRKIRDSILFILVKNKNPKAVQIEKKIITRQIDVIIVSRNDFTLF